MNYFELKEKYGETNQDGYYIIDHRKWHYYAERPKLYRRKKIKAWLYLLIPVAGMAGTVIIFDEMGLSPF